MTIQNANVNGKPEIPVISAHTEETILNALRILHGAIATYGNAFPAFEEMAGAGDSRERIASRALRAVNALHQHRQEEKVRAFRQGVKEVIVPYLETQQAAREQFLALPKEVRQFMPAFPTDAYIPFEAVSEVFPSGTNPDMAVKMLHQMGYKVSKKEGKAYVVVALPTR